MLELQRDITAEWKPLIWRSYMDLNGQRRAYINDGHDYLSLEKFIIDPDGTVHPSVLCSICGFHENVKLLGWSP